MARDKLSPCLHAVLFKLLIAQQKAPNWICMTNTGLRELLVGDERLRASRSPGALQCAAVRHCKGQFLTFSWGTHAGAHRHLRNWDSKAACRKVQGLLVVFAVGSEERLRT